MHKLNQRLLRFIFKLNNLFNDLFHIHNQSTIKDKDAV